MNHNDMKRNNGMRDTISATRGRHGSGGFAIRQQRMILTQGNCPIVCADEITDHSLRHYGSLPTTLRLVITRSGGFAIRLLLILAMLTAGIGGTWGQIEKNYTGTYYIANYNDGGYSATSNSDNFYLCPAMNYYDYNGTPPNQKPYLTTHKPDPTNRPTEPIAKWKIEFSTRIDNVDYYYIKYVAPNGDEKYIVHHDIVISGKEARIRYHLQADKDTNEDNNLFFFTQGVYNKQYKNFINICSKAEKSRAKGASLNPAKANSNDYYGTSGIGAEAFPGSSTQCGGLIGHFDENDKTGLWYLEDIVENPTISINSDGNAVISSNESATYHYTTDGMTNPTTGSTQYTVPFDITGIETIKAIAVVNGEVSNVATYTVGNGIPYLFQNQECTAYYMMPGPVASGNIPVNTSSIANEKMEWLLRNAGVVNGLQYYYIANKSTSNSTTNNYLYRTGNNIYVQSASSKLPTEDGYKFYLRQNIDGTYNIYPKDVMDNCLNKTSGNIATNNIGLAAGTNATAKWTFVSSDVADKKSLFDNPPFTLCNDINGTYYYKIVCLGTNGEKDSYIVPSATHAGISKTETDRNKSWMFAKASDDNWQNYYYIVSATTGKYMRFREEALTSSSTATLENAVILEDQPIPNDDRYQFLLAKAVNDKTSDDTYYIIPKTHKDVFSGNQYYGLWNDNNQVKTILHRAAGGRNVKWIFQPNTTDLFCLDPIATQDGDGNVSLECLTIGAEIHYTDNGDTPNSSSSAFDPSTPWTATDKKVIKAIAVLKNDDSVISDNTISVYNNPDITLDPEYTNYTYDRSAHEPSIYSVFIGETNIESTWYKTVTSSNYSNNINAGTAKVTLEDAPDDNIFVFNASKEFTINPVMLTVTANANQSKGYGDPDPVLTYTYDATAIVTGDVVEDIQTGELGRAPGETVGTYAINVGTLAFTNYSISFTGNDFEITKKSLGSGSTPAENITCDITETNGTHSIVVKQGGNDLTLGTDYTKNGETDGTKYYEVTVTGIGNYKDGFSVKLAKIKLSKLTGSSSPGGAALFVSNSGDGNFVVPSDMTAYIVTGISGNTLVIEELDNIPDNVPVLLLSTIDANGFVVQPKASATAPTGTNLLKEVTDDPSKHFNTADIYLLYKGEFVLNKEGDLAKGKIYLPKPSGVSPAPARLGIVWEQDTSIDTSQLSVLSSQLPGTWYTLDGRRLNSQPTKKGLYLWKGKKVVVK